MPPSVPEGRSRKILPGVLGSRKDVAPEELTFGQGFVEQELRRVRRKRRDRAREGCVGERVTLGHDGLARDTKGEAEVVDHGGHQKGATHDATGDQGGERDPQRRAEAQPAAGDMCGAHRTRPTYLHVIHGHVCALPGEDHLRGRVVRRCQSQSTSRRRLALVPTQQMRSCARRSQKLTPAWW